MAGGKHAFGSKVTATSLTITDLGTPSEYREEDGKRYRLVKTLASLSHGAQVQNAQIPLASDAASLVVLQANSTLKANGVYNAGGGASCVANACFWMQYNGVGAVLNGTATLASGVTARAGGDGVIAHVASIHPDAAFRLVASSAATVTTLMHIFCLG